MGTTQSNVIIRPDFVQRLKNKRVLVIGDIMLDNYLIGEAERISPEAPVPIVKVKSEREHLGGAGNVALSIAALGGQATIISAIGQDQGGERLQQLLSIRGVISSLITLQNRQTTIKTRIMAHRQQMIRLDQEQDKPYQGEELELLLTAIEKYIIDHEVIILSDYNKGIISEEFICRFQKILASKNPDAKVLIDPKPSNTRFYHLGNNLYALTPNLKETGECAGMMFIKNKTEILTAGRIIMDKTSVSHLLTTLGDSGMALFLSHEEVWYIPTVGRNVFDVTGAGDTVIATFGLGLSAGFDPLVSAILANYAAGIVVGYVGTATVSPSELEDAIKSLPQPSLSRWC